MRPRVRVCGVRRASRGPRAAAPLGQGCSCESWRLCVFCCVVGQGKPPGHHCLQVGSQGSGQALPGTWGQKARWWGVQYCGAELQDVVPVALVDRPIRSMVQYMQSLLDVGFYPSMYFLARTSCAAHMNYL